MTRRLPLMLTLVPAFVLGGCISFAPKPPKALLTLTSTAALPVGATQTTAGSATIVVSVLTVPQILATQRIPVQTGDTVAYVADALWVEPPQRGFARIVSDTLAARTGRVVLAQIPADQGARLGGELRNFGVDAAAGQAVVTFDAALIRGGGDAGTIEKRRFEARVPVSPIAAEPAGQALNAAANQVAAQVADWVGR